MKKAMKAKAMVAVVKENRWFKGQLGEIVRVAQVGKHRKWNVSILSKMIVCCLMWHSHFLCDRALILICNIVLKLFLALQPSFLVGNQLYHPLLNFQEVSMEWRDKGILLATRPFGETSLIIDVFTPDHGKSSGVVRGGQSKKLKPILQIGAQLDLTWKARLEEHLGSFQVELIRSRTE